MKRSEVCIVNTWSDRFEGPGQLSLLQVNDTVHVIEYRDSERSIAVDLDIVELREEDSSVRFTFPRGSSDRLVFTVKDSAEYSVLCRAKEDCQAICDLKLRLNSILRDSYYSGVYSNLDPDAKLILCDEVERMKKENPGVFFSSLLNSSELRDDVAGLAQAKQKSDSASIPLAEVFCVFCDASKFTHKDQEFVVHPNVPVNSTGKPTFMCTTCIENWKEFRETAEHEGNLILPGEINEEICAVCSDTPSTLVMCGDCPRSFCSTCLSRTLTAQEQADLDRHPEADWVCMCCIAGISTNPPLVRTAWKMVVPCPGRRGLYHGTLAPYVQTMQGTTPRNETTSPMETPKGKGPARGSASVDAAVAATAPLLSSLAGKRTRRPAGSLSGEEDSFSDASSDYMARGSSRRSHQVDSAAKPGARGSKGPGKGRRQTNHSYQLEDVDAAAYLQVQNKLAHPNNNRGRRMEKRQQQESSGTPSGAVLDERYYFGQYVGYYALLCEDVVQRKAALAAAAGARGPGKRKRNLEEVPTDDVCFLCKDGGELIECDWRCPGAKSGERCLKVYHTYCLDFEVSDEKWCCPRHYCDMCGSQTLKYICKYCPVSICANCPESLVNKYGHARYCVVSDPLAGEWSHMPTASGMQTIVCQSCVEMLESIERAAESSSSASTALVGAKGSAPLDLVRKELETERRFPGKFASGSAGAVTGIYLKEKPTFSSDDHTSSTSNKVVYTNAKKAKPMPEEAPTAAAELMDAPAVLEVDKKKAEVVVQEKKEKSVASHEKKTEVAQKKAERAPTATQPASTKAAPLTSKSSVSSATVDTRSEQTAPPKPAPVQRTSSSAADVAGAQAFLSMSAPLTAPLKGKKGASGATKSAASSPPASPRSNASTAKTSDSRSHSKASIVYTGQRPNSHSNGASHSKPTSVSSSVQNSPRATSNSPPKKRLASSLATYQIAMQLKGESSGAALQAATAAAAPAARSGGEKEADTRRTATSAPASTGAAKANSKADKPSDQGKKGTAAGSTMQRAGNHSTSSSDDEQVIQVKRVTRSRDESSLSTRSGKKLLSGSDLLPGLN